MQICVFCSFRKVYMQDYAGLCFMYANKDAELQNKSRSCFMCYVLL